jgi:hypothetical protein
MGKEGTYQTFDHLSREQIAVYARELQSAFQRERCLRQELEGINGELEQRLRELSALNRMFQKHLLQRSAGVEAYRVALAALRRIRLETTAVTERAEGEPLPEGNWSPMYP